MTQDQLRKYLEFYQDLGITALYRRSSADSLAVCQSEKVSGATTQPEMPAPQGDLSALIQIIDDIGDCRRCRLHEGRNKIVFGSGNPSAKLVFVGEGPGADEDEQGLP